MARYLITSALPYINGVKHLGNLAGSMLPADVYARYLRLRGHEVLYICATDEHGTPAELAAAEAGLDVRTYCDREHEVQKKAGEGFEVRRNGFADEGEDGEHARIISLKMLLMLALPPFRRRGDAAPSGRWML